VFARRLLVAGERKVGFEGARDRARTNVRAQMFTDLELDVTVDRLQHRSFGRAPELDVNAAVDRFRMDVGAIGGRDRAVVRLQVERRTGALRIDPSVGDVGRNLQSLRDFEHESDARIAGSQTLMIERSDRDAIGARLHVDLDGLGAFATFGREHADLPRQGGSDADVPSDGMKLDDAPGREVTRPLEIRVGIGRGHGSRLARLDREGSRSAGHKRDRDDPSVVMKDTCWTHGVSMPPRRTGLDTRFDPNLFGLGGIQPGKPVGTATSTLSTIPPLAVADDERVAAVVRRAQSGHVAAFAELYHAHSGRIYALCLRLVADPELAATLTQDVFVRAWEKLGGFRGESAFGTWLHRLAVNQVLGDRRTRLRRLAREQASAATHDGCAEPLGGVDARVDLERAIATLPAGARAVFVLYEIEGYRHEEIATMMELSIGTTKAQLHRARGLLRGLLK